ncbi:MAG: 2-oxoacid:acceptor oxidoreductase family protein [Candidatus Hodarchaeota archaeon]
MYEIRWHGRGGQGVITASEILASTALKEDKFFQSFPDFGPERMGAPVKAYTRIDDKPINIHSQIYEPDIVIVLDPSLLETINVAEGLKADCKLIVNSKLSKEEIRKKTKFDGNIFVIDATKIAVETIGKPIANICSVGALLKITGIVKKENLVNTIKEVLGTKLSDKMIKGNIDAAIRGFNEVN